MEDIRLIALDLDGTILTSEKKLTPRTKAAMEAAIAADIVVVLVTGRPLHGIPEELLGITGIKYAITSNGAVTTDVRNGVIVRNANLDAETTLEILDVPRRLDLVYTVFLDGIGYVETEPFDRHLKLVKGRPIEAYVRRSRRITSDLDSVVRHSTAGVENIWFIAHDQKERDELRREIGERWKVQVVLTEWADVEIGSVRADKGLAVTDLADSLGIRKEQIVAVGDSGNDHGMLQHAGIAVAMGNADEKIRSIADLITLSNDEDGAAIVIEQAVSGNLPA